MPEEVADTRPVSRDRGPAAAGPTPCAGHQLSCTFLSSAWASGAVSILSAVCGVRSAGRGRHAGPLPGAPPDRSSGRREGRRAFLPGSLSGGFLLAVSSPSPPRMSALDGSYVTQGPGNCPLILLVPPGLKMRSPEQCPGRPCQPVTALHCRRCWRPHHFRVQRTALDLGVKQGANTSQHLGPRTGGESEEAVVWGSVLPSVLCVSSEPSSLLSCDMHC